MFNQLIKRYTISFIFYILLYLPYQTSSLISCIASSKSFFGRSFKFFTFFVPHTLSGNFSFNIFLYLTYFILLLNLSLIFLYSLSLADLSLVLFFDKDLSLFVLTLSGNLLLTQVNLLNYVTGSIPKQVTSLYQTVLLSIFYVMLINFFEGRMLIHYYFSIILSY